MLGCSVFVGRVILVPERTSDATERRAFDEPSISIAVEIANRVAKRKGLSHDPGPYPRFGGDEYDTITIFQKRGRIWLSLLVKDDGLEIIYVITDQGRGEETETTSSLRRDLIGEVKALLPHAEVKYEQKSERGSLMGP